MQLFFLYFLWTERDREGVGEREGPRQRERRMEKESKTERQKEGGIDLVCVK